MPAAIPAVIGAAAAGAATAAFSGTAFAAIAGGALAVAASSLIGAAASFGAASLLGSAAKKPSQRATPTVAAAGQDRQTTVRSAIAARQVIYGEARVSGPLVFAASSGTRTDPGQPTQVGFFETVTGPEQVVVTNQFLHLVIPLASHVITEITGVWLDNVLIGATQIDSNGDVVDGPYAGLVRIRRYTGLQTAADPDLVAETAGAWSAAAVGRGIAYIYVRLRYDQDRLSGVPNIAARVYGRPVYDPRNGSTAWSPNFALCIRDWLLSEHGFNVAADEIDEPSFIAAANLSDEAALNVGVRGTRYTLDGAFDREQGRLEVLDRMLSAAGAVLVWQAGKFTLKPAAWETPLVELTADDARGEITVTPRQPRAQLINGVRGTYISPLLAWQASDFTPIHSPTYLAADNGQEATRDLELPFTVEPIGAMRLAQIELERNRRQAEVRFPAKLTALRLSVMDTVMLTLPDFGWNQKTFRVIGWALADNLAGVDLLLKEDDANVYAFTATGGSLPAPPLSALSSPRAVDPPRGLAVTEDLLELRGGVVVARATLTWIESVSSLVRLYEIESRAAGQTQWQHATTTSSLRHEIVGVPPGLREFRVRGVSALARSTWVSAARDIIGLSAPPPPPTNLQLQANGNYAYLTWDPIAEPDVRVGGSIVFRWTPSTGSVTWDQGITVGQEVPGNATTTVLPLRDGTYLARCRDSTGNWSTTTATIAASAATVVQWTVVASATEDPGFAGTKSGTVVSAGVLKLDRDVLLDSVADFDAIADLDALGQLLTSGSYTSTTTLDVSNAGAARAVRVTATIRASTTSEGDTLDSRPGSIDDWQDFDGAVSGQGDAWAEIRITQDNPGGSPVWGPWMRCDVMEVTCRGIQFRGQLRTGEGFNQSVDQFRLKAERV